MSFGFPGDRFTDQFFYAALFGGLLPEPADDIQVRVEVQLHVEAGGVCLVIPGLRFVPGLYAFNSIVHCYHLLWHMYVSLRLG